MFYDTPEKALGIFGSIVDFYSNGVALFPITVGIRDMNGNIAHVDDPALQKIGAQWRDWETNEQPPLIREIVRARKLGGEYLSLRRRREGSLRYQVLYPPQVDTSRTYHDEEGRPFHGVQYRASAPTPRPGMQVPGEYEWHLQEDMHRLWQRSVPFTGDATTDTRRLIRWLRRLDELDQKMFRSIDSRLMINKLLLLESNPDHRRGEPDVLVEQYLSAAELSRSETPSRAPWASVPFIGRTRNPASAKLIDLGGDINPADITAMKHVIEMIAQSTPIPAAALIEGNLSNRWSDWLLDRQVQKRAFQPEIEQVTIDGTQCHLRPTVRALQEMDPRAFPDIDVDDLRYVWRPLPPSLEGQPDLILRAWQLGLIDIDEATQLLGTTSPTPDTPGYEHWLVAARLAGPAASNEIVEQPADEQIPIGQDGDGTNLNAPTGEPEEASVKNWWPS